MRAVDGISFDVYEGETLGLVGESGCGKSTTARLLTRLLEPTGGEIIYKGNDITHSSRAVLKPLRRDMQMIFQDPYSSLNPRKTVGSIIGEPFIIHRLERDDDKRKKLVQELMDRVGLNPEHYNRFPHEFSGGQRQRIGVARAIALKPKLVVADEPVSALDVSIQAQIINLLSELQRELGLTIIFIAHDLSVVRHVCDRIAVMYLGKIVELAEADQLFDHPRHPVHGRAAVGGAGARSAHGAREAAPGARAATCPSPTNPPPACRFHTRCPKARDGVCNVDEPLLEVKEGGNIAACHFPLTDEEIAKRVPDRRGVSARASRASASSRQGTRTAADAAAAIGCEVGAICKSLVFRVGDEPLLIIASGANRVDEARFGARQGRRRPSCASTRASRSAACRPTATRARSRRSSTRTCWPTRRCGPRRGRRRRSSRSRPPTSSRAPAGTRARASVQEADDVARRRALGRGAAPGARGPEVQQRDGVLVVADAQRRAAVLRSAAPRACASSRPARGRGRRAARCRRRRPRRTGPPRRRPGRRSARPTTATSVGARSSLPRRLGPGRLLEPLQRPGPRTRKRHGLVRWWLGAQRARSSSSASVARSTGSLP